ncbi:MAG TPA: DUF928 domain-containing protein [Microcoleaceae cyanobacterium]|jgi:hypothetical protein
MPFNPHHPSSKVAFALCAAAAMLTTVTMAVPSQALEFPKTSDRGAPARTGGGGVRGGGCSASDKTLLTALMPNNNVGTTLADSPTLFFYVPKFPSKNAEFLLVDENGDDVYQMKVNLPASAGVIRVSLPEQTSDGKPLLEAGKNYSWAFSIVCDAKDRTRDLITEGRVRRVALNTELATALKTANSDVMKQAELYAKAGIWQETLELAASIRQSNPQVWRDLLKSVGLEKVAQAQFVK